MYQCCFYYIEWFNTFITNTERTGNKEYSGKKPLRGKSEYLRPEYFARAIVKIYDDLVQFTSREGSKLRVIATTYMKATDYKAIVELAKFPNTEVRINYEKLFHWQTQSGLSDTSKTAIRYMNHEKIKSKISLFVREYKRNGAHTSSFIFLGDAKYVSHQGNKPISFVWKLDDAIPANLLPKANKSVAI